jgi:hypothetical protein
MMIQGTKLKTTNTIIFTRINGYQGKEFLRRFFIDHRSGAFEAVFVTNSSEIYQAFFQNAG